MSPEAAGLLNEQMEQSRSNTLPVCRRRLLTIVRWYFSRGRGLDEFFTLWGYCAGLAFREGLGRGFLGRCSMELIGFARRSVSRRIGVNNPGWIGAAMVAWFVSGDIAFTRELFLVASQPVTDALAQNGAGRVWQARYVLNSVRVRHPDLADQIAELELTEGRPMIPDGEMPVLHGAA